MSQSIATSLIQSYRQVGDRADKWVIEPTSGRSYRQVGDRTDNQAIRTFFLVNLKKLEKFLTKVQVSVESAA